MPCLGRGLMGLLAGLTLLVWNCSQQLSFAQAQRKGDLKASVDLRQIPELVRGETIEFPAPPPIVVASGTKCDLKGNIYLVYTASPEPLMAHAGAISTLPISKLSLDSKSVTQYPVPTFQDYRDVVRLDFDVGPGGRVYALFAALEKGNEKPQPVYLVARYKDDGTVDSPVKLGNAPQGRIQPARLAVFRDGNLLVSGTFPDGRELRAFTALMDRTGTFVSEIRLAHDAKLVSPAGTPESIPGEESQPAGSALGQRGGSQVGGHLEKQKQKGEGDPIGAVSNGFMVTAPSGDIYILRAQDPPRLYVVAPTGDVIRQIDVRPPASGLTPSAMGMAGDELLFISFAHLGASNTEYPVEVLNPQTGELVAMYRLTARATLGCATSPYSFFTVEATPDSQHLQVTRYSQQ
jgi:hypothetical protein